MTISQAQFASFVVLFASAILHEVAHAYCAYRLGDPTAKLQGRLSFNPLVHIDPVLTLLLPGLLVYFGSPVIFGGAKPVPFNPMYFKNPRKGMVYVALAGPLSNILLAAIAYPLFYMLAHTSLGSWLYFFAPMIFSLLLVLLFQGVLVNLVLALFNLLPVPPLDGGRIAVGLLPLKLARPLARLEPYGFFVVVLLLYSGLVETLLGPVLQLAQSLLLLQK